MPQHFFFDLTDGVTTIRDTVGLVLSSLEEAASQAQNALQEMRFSSELSSTDDEWTLVIRDAFGETLMTMPVEPPDPPSKLAS